MGRFLNPNNRAFQITLNSEIYVDKTGLIEYTNKAIDTMKAFICNSRPRRFGKSMRLICLQHTIVRAVIRKKCFLVYRSAAWILSKNT